MVHGGAGGGCGCTQGWDWQEAGPLGAIGQQQGARRGGAQEGPVCVRLSYRCPGMDEREGEQANGRE